MPSYKDRQIDHIVILTGAGVSAESGIATFRDADGLWENHDPMEIATPEAFERNPALVYRFYNARRGALADVQPNQAHHEIARLQREFAGEVFLVTQNVDDLHERGGSLQVCHMHGQLRQALCQGCGDRHQNTADIDHSSGCPACGVTGGLRPDVVWFGEMPYHMPHIEAQLAACDLFIAVGTSGQVYPAAGFVRQAATYGARTIEINREVSEVTSYFDEQRQGLATRCVSDLVEELLAS